MGSPCATISPSSNGARPSGSESFWGNNNGYWVFWPTNVEKNDTNSSGRNLFVYNFWQKKPGRTFRISLGPGKTRPDLGFTPASVWSFSEMNPRLAITMDPGHMFGYAVS